MMNCILSMAMPYFISFIAEGAVALLLLVGVIIVAVKLKKQREMRKQVITSADEEYASSAVIPMQTVTLNLITEHSVCEAEAAVDAAEAAQTAEPVEAVEYADGPAEELSVPAGGSAEAAVIASLPVTESGTVLKNGFVIPSADGPVVKIRYDRSLKARLMQADDVMKSNYAEIVNYLMSFEDVKKRMSWNYDSISFGKEKIAKLNISGKSICLYLALNPKNFKDTKYNVTDVSQTKKYDGVPLMFRIRSKRSLKYAKELIDLTAHKFVMIKLSTPCEKVKAEDFPYATTERLINKKLIKVRIVQRKKSAANRSASAKRRPAKSAAAKATTKPATAKASKSATPKAASAKSAKPSPARTAPKSPSPKKAEAKK